MGLTWQQRKNASILQTPEQMYAMTNTQHWLQIETRGVSEPLSLSCHSSISIHITEPWVTSDKECCHFADPRPDVRTQSVTNTQHWLHIETGGSFRTVKLSFINFSSEHWTLDLTWQQRKNADILQTLSRCVHSIRDKLNNVDCKESG